MATSTPLTESSHSRQPRIRRQAGYGALIALNVVGLYIAHRLLDWEWPRFLTVEFDDVLPIITVSFLVSIAVNVVYCFDDSPRIKSVGEILDALTGFVAAVWLWQVFPFDFSTYATDWSWLVRLVIAIAIVGTVVGMIVETVKLVRGPQSEERSATGANPTPSGHTT